MFSRKITTTFAAIVLAAAVAVLAAGPSHGASGVPITTCGQTVTTNAVLTQDLTCGAQMGIVVGASGITIDLGGHHTITTIEPRRRWAERPPVEDRHQRSVRPPGFRGGPGPNAIGQNRLLRPEVSSLASR